MVKRTTIKASTPVQRAWAFPADGNKIHCLAGGNQTCFPAQLVRASPTPFHDEKLEAATIRINEILDELIENNPESNRELAFIAIPDGLFLVWTASGIGPESNEDEIRKALRIGKT